MRYCIRQNCNKPVKGIWSLCPYCRKLITDGLKRGEKSLEISNRLDINYHTVKRYEKQFKAKKTGSLLPPGHTYFDYRGQLEAMLKKLTEKTGIRNFNTQKGQIVLALINKQLEASRIQSKDDYAELWGDRYGYDREGMV